VREESGVDLALNSLGGYPKVGMGLLDAAVRVIAKVGKECHDRFYIIKALNLLAGDFFIKHLLFSSISFFWRMVSTSPHKPPPGTPPAAASPTINEVSKNVLSERTSPAMLRH
jgi:hypothetical protein